MAVDGAGKKGNVALIEAVAVGGKKWQEVSAMKRLILVLTLVAASCGGVGEQEPKVGFDFLAENTFPFAVK